MKHLATAALLGALVFPSSAGAVTAVPLGPSGTPYHLYHFDIRPIDRPTLTPQPPGDFELDFGKDGIINGYFRPHDAGRYIAVNGSIAGDRIWLTLGDDAIRNRLDGRMVGGRITGTARFEGGGYYFRLIPEAELGV